MRSSADGWIVTTSRVLSASCSVSAAQFRDGHHAAEQAARRARAERHDQLRLHDRALLLEPPFAALDLVGVRLLVQTALAARLELEMLHGIGDKCLSARNAGVGERAIEQSSGRPDERLAGEVLLVARLLADQHHACAAGALARHRLGGICVQRAAPARVLGLAQPLERAHQGGLIHNRPSRPPPNRLFGKQNSTTTSNPARFGHRSAKCI